MIYTRYTRILDPANVVKFHVREQLCFLAYIEEARRMLFDMLEAVCRSMVLIGRSLNIINLTSKVPVNQFTYT